jgi:hypothetical protein
MPSLCAFRSPAARSRRSQRSALRTHAKSQNGNKIHVNANRHGALSLLSGGFALRAASRDPIWTFCGCRSATAHASWRK